MISSGQTLPPQRFNELIPPKNWPYLKGGIATFSHPAHHFGALKQPFVFGQGRPRHSVKRRRLSRSVCLCSKRVLFKCFFFQWQGGSFCFSRSLLKNIAPLMYIYTFYILEWHLRFQLLFQRLWVRVSLTPPSNIWYKHLEPGDVLYFGPKNGPLITCRAFGWALWVWNLLPDLNREFPCFFCPAQKSKRTSKDDYGFTREHIHSRTHSLANSFGRSLCTSLQWLWQNWQRMRTLLGELASLFCTAIIVYAQSVFSKPGWHLTYWILMSPHRTSFFGATVFPEDSKQVQAFPIFGWMCWYQGEIMS